MKIKREAALAAIALAVFLTTGAQFAAAESIHVKLPGDVKSSGLVFYEAYQGGNTFPSANNPLRYSGTQNVQNGSIINSGPIFAHPQFFFPYALYDQSRNLLLLHPGVGGGFTGSLGASVSYLVAADGTYNVSGAFARANNFQSAGDGVEVAIFKNFDATASLFTASISSNNAVDADDPFSGTGVAPFSLMVPLTQGDVLRFVVYSGPSGDGGFDVTAFQTNIIKIKGH